MRVNGVTIIRTWLLCVIPVTRELRATAPPSQILGR
jgi:hypothetical protein